MGIPSAKIGNCKETPETPRNGIREMVSSAVVSRRLKWFLSDVEVTCSKNVLISRFKGRKRSVELPACQWVAVTASQMYIYVPQCSFFPIFLWGAYIIIPRNHILKELYFSPCRCPRNSWYASFSDRAKLRVLFIGRVLLSGICLGSAHGTTAGDCRAR